eukprot:13327507-Heterocapsa_arctica.AAC.1
MRLLGSLVRVAATTMTVLDFQVDAGTLAVAVGARSSLPSGASTSIGQSTRGRWKVAGSSP